jgi:hypothetical protein
VLVLDGRLLSGRCACHSGVGPGRNRLL